MTTPAAIDDVVGPFDPQKWAMGFGVDIAVAVSELPDRTSPDDWPEAMLVTASELSEIIEPRILAELDHAFEAGKEEGYLKGASDAVDPLKHHRAIMACVKLGKWMSAALDDPAVCADMKADIREWFSAGEPQPGWQAGIEYAALITSLAKERDEATTYTRSLLVSFVNEHCNPVPDWAPLPDLIGMLTQIDNATTVCREAAARADAAEREVERVREDLEQIHQFASKGHPLRSGFMHGPRVRKDMEADLLSIAAIAAAALSPVGGVEG